MKVLQIICLLNIGLEHSRPNRIFEIHDNWFALKAMQSFEFGSVDKKCVYTRITFSRFLAYEGEILMHVIITQYKVLFK